MLTSPGPRACSSALGVAKSLNARIDRLRAMTIATPGRGEELNREMNALVDRSNAERGEAAAAASRAHIKRTSELALRVLAEREQHATETD